MPEISGYHPTPGKRITKGVKSAVNAAALARQWYRKQNNFTN